MFIWNILAKSVQQFELYIYKNKPFFDVCYTKKFYVHIKSAMTECDLLCLKNLVENKHVCKKLVKSELPPSSYEHTRRLFKGYRESGVESVQPIVLLRGDRLYVPPAGLLALHFCNAFQLQYTVLI